MWLQKVRQMGVTAVRYPGGNFVSNYDWRDGIGPVEKRPRKRDLAWKSIETNEVGLDEFMKWADAAEVAPIYAVNLGTKGIEEALAVLEYCNMETGTYYSDLRAANGTKSRTASRPGVWAMRWTETGRSGTRRRRNTAGSPMRPERQ